MGNRAAKQIENGCHKEPYSLMRKWLKPYWINNTPLESRLSQTLNRMCNEDIRFTVIVAPYGSGKTITTRELVIDMMRRGVIRGSLIVDLSQMHKTVDDPVQLIFHQLNLGTLPREGLNFMDLLPRPRTGDKRKLLIVFDQADLADGYQLSCMNKLFKDISEQSRPDVATVLLFTEPRIAKKFLDLDSHRAWAHNGEPLSPLTPNSSKELFMKIVNHREYSHTLLTNPEFPQAIGYIQRTANALFITKAAICMHKTIDLDELERDAEYHERLRFDTDKLIKEAWEQKH